MASVRKGASGSPGAFGRNRCPVNLIEAPCNAVICKYCDTQPTAGALPHDIALSQVSEIL